ncbi:MAG: YeeE/YedE family protein [Nitrospirae bacterium]|nr:MAG: YeeE/YedE family protein [Nitrospirota bacterium]
MVMTILSGLIIGMAVGWVFQRGRYCMNTAFRDTIFINDYTLFKAYLLALIITTIGANFLESIGQIEELRRQAFFPIANIVGGYIFGLGIVLAGGCGSGIWYKMGEGQVNAMVSVLGFMIGIFTTAKGFLSPINNLLSKISVWVTPDGIKVLNESQLNQLWDQGVDLTVPTLYNIFGINKWIVIAVFAVVVIPFLIKGGVQKPQKGYSWPLTGVLTGLVIIAAWWASELWGGGARGVSYTGPTKELFSSIMLSKKPTWSAMLVLGTPIGAILSALGLKEFKLKAPGAEELLRVFVGGLIMGVGATIGGGCNVGHGLTGFSTLALSSIVATIFIILGNWTMVYFLFIKPMQDLDI